MKKKGKESRFLLHIFFCLIYTSPREWEVNNSPDFGTEPVCGETGVGSHDVLFQVFPLGPANTRSNVNFIATKLAQNESKIVFNMKTKQAVPTL